MQNKIYYNIMYVNFFNIKDKYIYIFNSNLKIG